VFQVDSCQLNDYQKALMEATSTSEMLVNFYQTTRSYNPEDSHLHTRRRENLILQTKNKVHFGIGCLDLSEKKWPVAGYICTMSSFIICTLRQYWGLLGRSNQEGKYQEKKETIWETWA
jgi:hypothetical protein